MNFKESAKDYQNMYGFNVIPLENKKPIGEWKKWQIQRMDSSAVDFMNWNERTNGIGAICGINRLRCFDFDKADTSNIVERFVLKLGLTIEYKWIVKTGNGFHVWFYCDDNTSLIEMLGSKKSAYNFQLKENGLCDHIELRWNNCLTVLPLSMHPSGKTYEFVNDGECRLPESKPEHVEVEKLKDVLKEFCILDDERDLISEKRVDHRWIPKGSLNIKPQNIQYVNNAAEFLKGKISNYDEFLMIGFSLASLGEEGRKYFLMIGLNNPKYTHDTVTSLNHKYDSFIKDKRGRVTLGSFFYIATKYGWQAPEEIKKVKKDWFALTKEYLTYNYEFRFNELTQKLMWKSKGEERFIEVTDSDLNTFYLDIRSEYKVPIGHEDIRRILNSDFVEKFDPLIQFFSELEKWDGHDYIHDLAETIKCDLHEQKYWEFVLRKWLVASVAGVLNDKEVNHTAIIFQGGQGIGKSRWILKLIPEKLSDYLFTGNILPSDKDSKLAVVKNFIINLDELESLRYDEIGFLKSLMTQKEMQIRKPYGYYEQKYIRRSSFIGSVNKSEFLNDTTGSRRFLCFEVVSIQTDHKIDMNKVFSQALHLFEKGFQYWFDKEDSDELTIRNEKFTFRTIEEEKILEKYVPVGKNDPGAKFLTATEIAEKLLSEKQITNSSIKQIGAALSKHKFVKLSKRVDRISIKKWVVKEITVFNKDATEAFNCD